MESGTKRTAVLIFAYSATVETRRKKSVGNTELFEELNAHTLNTVKKTGLPFYHFSEKQQHGESFGERFSNAIQSIFNKGFDNIITIGNDSPQLKSSDLLEVERQLQLEKTVLGPSADGGFYTMGLPRTQFDFVHFSHLPWQRPWLLSEILGLFRNLNANVHLLSVLNDLDSLDDINVLLGQINKIPQRIVRLLKGLCISNGTIVQTMQFHPIPNFFTLHFNKGSPFSYTPH